MSFDALRRINKSTQSNPESQGPVQNTNNQIAQQNAQGSHNELSFYKPVDASQLPFRIPVIEDGEGAFEPCEKTGFMGYKGNNKKHTLGYVNIMVHCVNKTARMDDNGNPVLDELGNVIFDETKHTIPLKATIPLYSEEPQHLHLLANRKNLYGEDQMFTAEFKVFAYEDYHGQAASNNTSFVFTDKDGNLFDKEGNKVK